MKTAMKHHISFRFRSSWRKNGPSSKIIRSLKWNNLLEAPEDLESCPGIVTPLEHLRSWGPEGQGLRAPSGKGPYGPTLGPLGPDPVSGFHNKKKSSFFVVFGFVRCAASWGNYFKFCLSTFKAILKLLGQKYTIKSKLLPKLIPHWRPFLDFGQKTTFLDFSKVVLELFRKYLSIVIDFKRHTFVCIFSSKGW